MSQHDSARLAHRELSHVHQERFTTHNPTTDPAQHRPGVRP